MTIINYISGKITRKIDTGVKVCCSIVMNDSLLLMGCFYGAYLAIDMKDFSMNKRNIMPSKKNHHTLKKESLHPQKRIITASSKNHYI